MASSDEWAQTIEWKVAGQFAGTTLEKTKRGKLIFFKAAMITADRACLFTSNTEDPATLEPVAPDDKEELKRR